MNDRALQSLRWIVLCALLGVCVGSLLSIRDTLETIDINLGHVTRELFKQDQTPH